METLERLKMAAIKRLDELTEAGALVKPAHDFFVAAIGKMESATDVLEYMTEFFDGDREQMAQWLRDALTEEGSNQ